MPVVLVGHSIGGLTTRLYVGEHPGDVSGVVLLDPTVTAFARMFDDEEFRPRWDDDQRRSGGPGHGVARHPPRDPPPRPRRLRLPGDLERRSRGPMGRRAERPRRSHVRWPRPNRSRRRAQHPRGRASTDHRCDSTDTRCVDLISDHDAGDAPQSTITVAAPPTTAALRVVGEMDHPGVEVRALVQMNRCRRTGRPGARCARCRGPAVAGYCARAWSVRAAQPTAPR